MFAEKTERKVNRHSIRLSAQQAMLAYAEKPVFLLDVARRRLSVEMFNITPCGIGCYVCTHQNAGYISKLALSTQTLSVTLNLTPLTVKGKERNPRQNVRHLCKPWALVLTFRYKIRMKSTYREENFKIPTHILAYCTVLKQKSEL